jgi:hypothetical protein
MVRESSEIMKDFASVVLPASNFHTLAVVVVTELVTRLKWYGPLSAQAITAQNKKLVKSNIVFFIIAPVPFAVNRRSF